MTTTFRTHVSLNARDVARSIAFYTTLFGVPPTKARVDYAKWDLADPGLVLSVNAASGLGEPEAGRPAQLSHLGLRVDDDAVLRAEHARLAAAGVPILLEETGVTCCYAVQDKFWVHDPDGNAWEIYRFLGDAATKSGEHAPVDACCPTPAGAASCC